MTSDPSGWRTSARSSTDPAHAPAVVVGGVEWEPGVNYPSTQTVRELSRSRPVLYLYTEARGGVGERLRALLLRRRPGGLVGTAFKLRARHAGGNLWLAPLRGLSTIAPLGFPEPLRRHNLRLLRRAIADWLPAIGADRCLLIFYWWFVPELVQAIPNVASVYDCVDEHADYPGSALKESTVRRIEGRLLDSVDCSFAVSPALLPPREAPGRRLDVLPNGFDTRTFAEVCGAGFGVPEPLRSVEGPVIGCIGGLGGRVDAGLVGELVGRRPDWTFAFIGADVESELPDLAGRDNVLALGVLPYREALAAMSRFDVGVIPFLSRPFTRGNSFLKLLDQLAHGMPVVATPLPDTVAVARHEGLVRLAEGPDAWEGAIADALAEPPDSARRQARRDYVQERSVERRVQRMLEACDLSARTGGDTSRRCP